MTIDPFTRMRAAGVPEQLAAQMVRDAHSDPRLTLIIVKLPTAPLPGHRVRMRIKGNHVGSLTVATVAIGTMGRYAVLGEPAAANAADIEV